MPNLIRSALHPFLSFNEYSAMNCNTAARYACSILELSLVNYLMTISYVSLDD